jgi:hypothetical protein
MLSTFSTGMNNPPNPWANVKPVVTEAKTIPRAVFFGGMIGVIVGGVLIFTPFSALGWVLAAGGVVAMVGGMATA